VTQESTTWLLSNYAPVVKKILQEYNVEVPEDSNICVFYGPRYEYYYENVAKTYTYGKGQECKTIPILFMGDSAGGTDYRLGLSLSRGMKLMELLGDIMKKEGITSALTHIGTTYSKMWATVLKTEFNQNNPRLRYKPNMVYRYALEGRTVDGVEINDTHPIALITKG
jgi:hypothetical protein